MYYNIRPKIVPKEVIIVCFHPILSKLVIGCGVSILSWLFKWSFGEVLEEGNVLDVVGMQKNYVFQGR
jgi:hypothetical protein